MNLSLSIQCIIIIAGWYHHLPGWHPKQSRSTEYTDDSGSSTGTDSYNKKPRIRCCLIVVLFVAIAFLLVALIATVLFTLGKHLHTIRWTNIVLTAETERVYAIC